MTDCPVCLLPVAPTTCCQHAHSMHLACALEMRRVMGRDTCPLCTGKMALPALSPPALCLLEHGLHMAVGVAELLLIVLLGNDKELREDALMNVRRAQAAVRSRASVRDQTTDLTAIRVRSMCFVCVWCGLLAAMVWIHDSGFIWTLTNVHLSFFRFMFEMSSATMFTTCPTDPTCVQIRSPAQLWDFVRGTFINATLLGGLS